MEHTYDVPITRINILHLPHTDRPDMIRSESIISNKAHIKQQQQILFQLCFPHLCITHRILHNKQFFWLELPSFHCWFQQSKLHWTGVNDDMS